MENSESQNNTSPERDEDDMNVEGIYPAVRELLSLRRKRSLKRQFRAYKSFRPIGKIIDISYELRKKPTVKVYNLPESIQTRDYDVFRDVLKECLSNNNIPRLNAYLVMTIDVRNAIKEIRQSFANKFPLEYFDQHRQRYKGYVLSQDGIKTRGASLEDELYNWCKTFSHTFRVCYLTKRGHDSCWCHVHGI